MEQNKDQSGAVAGCALRPKRFILDTNGLSYEQIAAISAEYRIETHIVSCIINAAVEAAPLPVQSGAAVRALPSDLTECEQINLLCQVETYMTITEKHSQTAPEAVAEETRMYGMVNGFIAKRFSDIGAAVRGEAVAITAADAVHILRLALVNAECAIKGREHTGFITKALDATKGPFAVSVSARAADAPSEQSESGMRAVLINAKAVIQRWDSPLWRQEVHTAEWIDQLRKSVELAESRAADALDSQPTDATRYQRLRVLGAAPFGSKQLDAGNVLRFQGLDAFIDADLAAHSSRGEASSQPTDGGVRNG